MKTMDMPSPSDYYSSFSCSSTASPSSSPHPVTYSSSQFPTMEAESSVHSNVMQQKSSNRVSPSSAIPSIIQTQTICYMDERRRDMVEEAIRGVDAGICINRYSNEYALENVGEIESIHHSSSSSSNACATTTTYSISSSSTAYSSSSSLLSSSLTSSSSSSISSTPSSPYYTMSHSLPPPPLNTPSSPSSPASCIPPPPLMKLQSYTFNQDFSCFVCATTAGIRVYTCTPLSEFCRLEYPHWGNGSYDVAVMLFRTNVFAVVCTQENKKVKLWDDQRKRFIGELRSRQQVINVCLGRDILAIVTEYQIYIYQSEQMHPYNIIHTGANPRGLCVVTSGLEKDKWKIACPAVAPGAVRIHTSEGEDTSHVFQAHQTALATLSFNSSGSMLATASETGTVVRVFSVFDGQLLHEFRRGTQTHTISCLAFRPDNMFLAVASSSNTLHIFKLSTHINENQYNSGYSNSPSSGGGGSCATALRSSVSGITGGSGIGGGNVSNTGGGVVDGGLGGMGGKNDGGGGGSGGGTGLWIDGTHFMLQNKKDYYSNASDYDSNNNNNRVVGGGTGMLSCDRAFNDTKGRLPNSLASNQINQAINAGRDLTSVVYDTSKEMVQDVLKGVLPRYFMSTRSFAQFHIPDDSFQSIDVRSPTSSIVGPLCAFAGEKSNHLYLLHHNGLFYEFRFDSYQGGNECALLTATTWFSPRPDFRIQSYLGVESFPSDLEGGFEGDDWQIVL